MLKQPTELVFTLLLFLPFLCSFGQESTVLSCDAEITVALQNNDWPKVNALVRKNNKGQVFDCSSSPVLRLLYGHSSLAIGKYNEAMNQFYCSCDSTQSETLKKWSAWTETQLSKNVNASNLNFLYGDALARTEKYDQARAAFTKAIKLSPQNFMAYNARGVNQWIINMENKESECFSCTEDWNSTIKLNPGFVDGQINFAVSQLLVGGMENRCVSYFEKALNIAPSFALAHNGKKLAFFSAGQTEQYNSYKSKAKGTPFWVLDSLANFIDSTIVVMGARGANLEIGGKALTSTADMFNSVGKLVYDKITTGTTDARDWNNLNNSLKSGIEAFKVKIPMGKGGVYSTQDDYNTETREAGVPSMSGTWFLLNYPSQKWFTEKSK